MKRHLLALAAASALALSGCANLETTPEATAPSPALVAALDAQPAEAQARYGARNPAETLAFFGVEPGMTVVEALPGGGWYTKILIPYLGDEGTIVGAHYPDEIWPVIIPGADEERIAGFIARTDGWPEQAAEWVGAGGTEVISYRMTQAPDIAKGQVDVALFIRAMHNMSRVEQDMGLMSAAIAETYELVKPGGVVGVVQHRGPETNSDEWAVGNAGYLKQSNVIAAFEAAGFELEATSEINANPLDMPTEEDFVWRLSPTLATTEEGTPERAAMEAIGESDRMTLKFRKPA